MSFKENAIQAAVECKVEIELANKESKRQQNANSLDKAEKAFAGHYEAIDIDIETGNILVDGIALKYISSPPGYKSGWRVIGTCPNCGEEASSRICTGIVGIGEQLENFQPDTDVPGATHICSAEQTFSADFPEYNIEPTVAEILEDLFRLIAQEEAEKIFDNR